VTVMRHRRTSATSLIVIVASFVRCPGPARTEWAYLRCGIRLLPGSGGAIRRNRCGPRRVPAPNRHERVLSTGRPVSGRGIAHDLAGSADAFKIPATISLNGLVPGRRSQRCHCAAARGHIGNAGSNVVRAIAGKDGREPDQFRRMAPPLPGSSPDPASEVTPTLSERVPGNERKRRL